jgi:putative two-component system response regulator
MRDSGEEKPLVLIVDDDESIRLLLRRYMEADGYLVATAEDGLRAVVAAEAELPDLVLLDAQMPAMDGFQVAEAFKSSERTRTIPVIMITVLGDKDSRMRALKAGVQEFLTKPVDRNELSLRVRNVLLLKEYNNYLANRNRSLEQQVRERSREVIGSYRETIETLCRAAAYKDEESGAHVRIGMNQDFCEAIHYASPMHDIGKVAIPDAILFKRGPLSREEWEIMKSHAAIGAQLLGTGDSPYLRMGAEIAMHHHERWDGSGYPGELKGQLIPISARIMNICDQYDALRSERPHKKAMSHEGAVEIITVGDGRTMPAHFDPDVLEAFVRSAERFREIYESIRD